jgi:hypothetical protein
MPPVNFKRVQQRNYTIDRGVHVGLMPLVTSTVLGNKWKYK